MYGEDSPSPYRIITTLRRTERSVAAALEAAAGTVNLTAAQFHVLEELTVTEVLQAGELAWRHRVTRQSMHGIVQNLARAHLVELAPKEHGSRSAWLTQGGRDPFAPGPGSSRPDRATGGRGRRRWRPRTARAVALRHRTIGGGHPPRVVVGLTSAQAANRSHPRTSRRLRRATDRAPPSGGCDRDPRRTSRATRDASPAPPRRTQPERDDPDVREVTGRGR